MYICERRACDDPIRSRAARHRRCHLRPDWPAAQSRERVITNLCARRFQSGRRITMPLVFIRLVWCALCVCVYARARSNRNSVGHTDASVCDRKFRRRRSRRHTAHYGANAQCDAIFALPARVIPIKMSPIYAGACAHESRAHAHKSWDGCRACTAVCVCVILNNKCA